MPQPHMSSAHNRMLRDTAELLVSLLGTRGPVGRVFCVQHSAAPCAIIMAGQALIQVYKVHQSYTSVLHATACHMLTEANPHPLHPHQHPHPIPNQNQHAATASSKVLHPIPCTRKHTAAAAMPLHTFLYPLLHLHLTASMPAPSAQQLACSSAGSTCTLSR